jgi:tetratricopeptide (TPR) repeat protein
VHTLAATVAYWGRDHLLAIENARRAQDLDPRFGQSPLGTALAALGRHEEALVELRRAEAASHGASFFLTLVGWALGIAGRLDEARDVARRLEERSRSEYVLPLFFAWVHIGLGDRETAFDWLERACRQRGFRIHLLVDPVYDPVRADPRFGDLLRRIGLQA